MDSISKPFLYGFIICLLLSSVGVYFYSNYNTTTQSNVSSTKTGNFTMPKNNWRSNETRLGVYINISEIEVGKYIQIDLSIIFSVNGSRDISKDGTYNFTVISSYVNDSNISYKPEKVIFYNGKATVYVKSDIEDTLMGIVDKEDDVKVSYAFLVYIGDWEYVTPEVPYKPL